MSGYGQTARVVTSDLSFILIFPEISATLKKLNSILYRPKYLMHKPVGDVVRLLLAEDDSVHYSASVKAKRVAI